MAVNRVPQGSRVIISIQNGVNTAGQPKYFQRTYRNVKAGAVDTDVYAVAQAIAGLQKYPVSSISRVDESNLVNL